MRSRRPSARPESTGDPQALASLVAGSNVFVLFDTSNYMYRGFVFAQDAIADFIRSLQSADKVAFYSYSRDLSRATPLTADRSRILRGVRSTVAGDDAALGLMQGFAHARNSENWADAGDRVTGRHQHDLRVKDCFDDPGSGFRIGGAGKAN